MGLQILSKPMKKGSEEHSQELKKIALEQVGYMEIILEDLLNYARPPALKLEWLDLTNVLNETTNMLQGVIQEHQATLHTNIQQGLPTLYADSAKLRLILSNIISNSIQAASESGKQPEVTLSAMSRLGDKIPSIQIEISDNGPGIDSGKVEQLFEPFYTSRAKGTGLGLAIVKGFVEQHHGQISLGSNPNREGTICTILLPISELMTHTNGEA
jgi:signal transduction histidine kinase